MSKQDNEQDQGANDQDTLKLCISDNSGSEFYVKVRYNTPMDRIMNAYCQNFGVSKENVNFLFDGVPIHGGQTPKELNMEQDDHIDVLMKQIGGF